MAVVKNIKNAVVNNPAYGCICPVTNALFPPPDEPGAEILAIFTNPWLDYGLDLEPEILADLMGKS